MRTVVTQFVAAQAHWSERGDIAAADYDPGNRRERRKQRFHLLVTQSVEGRERECVGFRFNEVFSSRPASVNDPSSSRPRWTNRCS